MIRSIVLTGLLFPSLLMAASGERINESKNASAMGFVGVYVVRGSVEISGWDREEIRVSGRLDEQTEEFVFDVRGDEAEIRVELPSQLNSWCCEQGSDLKIEVPKGSRIEVSLVSANMRVENIHGGAELGSVSGEIDASDLKERVRINNVSGEVDARDFEGRTIIKTVSGDIDAVDIVGPGTFHSVSGDINLRNVGDELDLETVSGDVEVENAKVISARGHTVSGDIDLDLELVAGGGVDFDSVSGSVRLQLSGALDARFDLETRSGSIRNRLTDDKPKESKYVRDETLRFVMGSGEGEVVINSRSGDISLSRP